MTYSEKSLNQFANDLASKAPVPGGGGAAALVAALGVALGSMVCNLTFGKKKYAEHEPKLREIVAEATRLQQALMSMIDEDAQHFLPLSRAYGMPQSNEAEKAEKARVLEQALKEACSVPMRIVAVCREAIDLHADIVDRGSRLVLSDVGCGIQLLKAALICGELNVMVNLGLIQDDVFVVQVRETVHRQVEAGKMMADRVYSRVESLLVQ
ncbi:MAG: cyclodeaminase/cyclohydrolase family protein [Proteobacteria bacterium]|nr:cyclodeaminase/cyclohydrolase family protein [Pseudomonadota bacterium]MDE3207342.1 cyclodeaminase/cyclohydrolase family protein [Pseudomonadota bacterium]